jgi:hypothetical protein
VASSGFPVETVLTPFDSNHARFDSMRLKLEYAALLALWFIGFGALIYGLFR